MSIIKRVTHPASLSFVNLILALGSVPTVALSSSTRKSRIMIPVGICSCQCTIIPERVFNLGGITDQFVRNKWSTSPVSVVFQNGIFRQYSRPLAVLFHRLLEMQVSICYQKAVALPLRGAALLHITFPYRVQQAHLSGHRTWIVRFRIAGSRPRQSILSARPQQMTG